MAIGEAGTGIPGGVDGVTYILDVRPWCAWRKVWLWLLLIELLLLVCELLTVSEREAAAGCRNAAGAVVAGDTAAGWPACCCDGC